MPIVRSKQSAIFYTTDGDPALPSLLFSNSLGTDHSMWQAQTDTLSAFFHVIRYDTRGHGMSGSPPGPYQMADLGQDVIAVLDALGLAKVHFCGLSLGGVTAQWLALHASERIERLIIANSAAKVGSCEAWLARAASVRSDGLGAVADGAAARWFTSDFIAQQAARDPDQVALLVAGLRAGNVEGYASCCAALAQADYREDVHAIAHPTLIISGQHDPVTTLEDAAFLQQNIAASRMGVLSASHISNIEAAAPFTQALLDFLKP